MRKNKLLLTFLCTLAFSTLCFGEDEKVNQIVADKEGDLLSQITESVDGVQEAITTCRAAENATPAFNGRGSLEECIWASFDEAKQNEIFEALEQYKSGRQVSESATGEAARSDDPLYNYNLGNFKINKTKSIVKLEEYLQKRLTETLKGEGQDGKLGVVDDHTKFLEVWRSQLGKNLITQLANYCIYSDPISGLVPTADIDRKFYFITNRDNLTNLVPGPDGSQSPQSFSGYNRCIAKISSECLGNGATAATQTPPPVGDTPGQQTPAQDSRRAYIDSQQLTSRAVRERVEAEPGLIEKNLNISSACELSRYMTGVKKTLKEVESLVDGLREHTGGTSFGTANVTSNEEFSTDKFTNIGSKELMDAEGYKEAVEEEVANIDVCARSANPTDACAEYFSDKEENQKIKDEFLIRNLALGKKIEKNLTGDGVEVEMDDLKKFFTDKGMKDENFAKLVELEVAKAEQAGEDTDPRAVIKKVINNYYTKEREALQKSLRDRLRLTELNPEDPNDPSQTGTQDPGAQLNRIKASIQQSPTELATIYHYSNIVSSFLKVGRENARNNTAALAAELEANFLDDPAGGRGVAGRNFDELQGLVEDADPGEPNGGVQLGSGEIDTIQYGIENE